MADEIGPFLKEDTDSPFRGKPIKMVENGDGSWSLALDTTLGSVSDTAMLTAASPNLTLPLAGQRYIGFTLGTNDWGNSWGELALYASTDGGDTFPTTLAFFDQGVNEIWYTVGLPDTAATTPTIYWAQADPGVTHVRLALSGAGPVHVRLFASATGPDIPQYVAGIGDSRPPLMVFVAALDGSGNLSPFLTGSQAASNGLAVTPTALHDGAQGNLWNAATTGAGGFSDPYTVTQGTTVAIVGHVSAATDISLQLSQDGTNFYTATLPAPVVLTGAGDFSFLATIPLNVTFRLQSKNSVTATATAMTSN